MGGGVLAWVLSHNSDCEPPLAVPADAPSMQAVRYACYGDSDALVLARVARPEPADDELLVRVHAAGVNPLDWHYMQGQPYIMRLSSGIGRQSSTLAGVDFSGVVEAIGVSVTKFQVGDRVFGARSGAFAEYLVVRESRAVMSMPANTSFEDAAAMPIAAVTALQAVRDAGRVGPGTRVLVNGASGGVGTYAVQIAKSLGAEVTGVSSGRNIELVRSLGAEHTIDYTQQDFTVGDKRYDVIIDNVGNRPLGAYRRALVDHGILVMVTGPKSNRWLGPVARMLWARLSAPFVSQTHVSVLADMNPQDLDVLREMVEAGTLRSTIDRRFGLAEVAQAIDYLAQGRTRGKNVIVMMQH
ncbi:MAG TPA: NAD(P)-dependent alcohol dehydrogenase [Xanthomonadaceae bacterium]|nr:NAD(P)-dependent alcohol dehydrogenase [Xanthomonadaceae bacterium]